MMRNERMLRCCNLLILIAAPLMACTHRPAFFSSQKETQLVAVGEFWFIAPEAAAHEIIKEHAHSGEPLDERQFKTLVLDGQGKAIRVFMRPSMFLTNAEIPQMVGGEFNRIENHRADFKWGMFPDGRDPNTTRYNLRFEAISADYTVDTLKRPCAFAPDSGKYQLFGPIRMDGKELYAFIKLDRHPASTAKASSKTGMRFPAMICAKGKANQIARNNKTTSGSAPLAVRAAFRIEGEILSIPQATRESRLLKPLLKEAGSISEETLLAMNAIPDTRLVFRPRLFITDREMGRMSIERNEGGVKAPLLDLTVKPTLQPDGKVMLKVGLLLDSPPQGCGTIDNTQILQPGAGRYAFIGSCAQGENNVYAFLMVERVE